MSESKNVLNRRIICNESPGTIKYVGTLVGTNEGN